MKLLFKYCITTQPTTGQSLSDLLYGRCLHSHLDLLRPHLSTEFVKNRTVKKQIYNHHAQKHSFTVDDKSLLRTMDMLHHGFQV